MIHIKKKKTTILYFLVFALILVNVYYFVVPLFSYTNINLEKISSDTRISSKDIIQHYVTNEAHSNLVFNGKVVEVVGKVKEISFLNNRNTVILHGQDKDSGIICDVHPSQIEKLKVLKTKQTITVKGICKGFLKDVILLNCFIDTNQHE